MLQHWEPRRCGSGSQSPVIVNQTTGQSVRQNDHSSVLVHNSSPWRGPLRTGMLPSRGLGCRPCGCGGIGRQTLRRLGIKDNCLGYKCTADHGFGLWGINVALGLRCSFNTLNCKIVGISQGKGPVRTMRKCRKQSRSWTLRPFFRVQFPWIFVTDLLFMHFKH